MISNSSFPHLTITVLMLEDNTDDAALISRQLASHGIFMDKESSHVRSAKEFIDRVASRRFDLILCDFTLPGWNGLEALRWVRRSGHDTPFIYVSGTLGEEVAVECIREGATDYVLKNNLSRLPHAVRRALDEWELRHAKERIEKEKRDSVVQYRLLFDGNPQPMWVIDRNTLAFLAVNDAAIRHYGYTRQEFLQMILLDILPSNEIPSRLRSVLRNVAPKSQVTETALHVKKDRSVIDVEVSRNLLNFGGTEAILMTARDVTEFKKNEDKLRHSGALPQ